MFKKILLFLVVSIAFIFLAQAVFAYTLDDFINYLKSLVSPFIRPPVIGGFFAGPTCQACSDTTRKCPDWGSNKGGCLPSCGQGGGPTAVCQQASCTSGNNIQSWDCNYCCVPASDPCSGITCNDYCSGNTRYYSGYCSNGQCMYNSQNCPNGCSNGQCNSQPACQSHDQCSQACTSLCPANVYGCCYGCNLGQCSNGNCVCEDATGYCSGNPNYQVGSSCKSGTTTTTPSSEPCNQIGCYPDLSCSSDNVQAYCIDKSTYENNQNAFRSLDGSTYWCGNNYCTVACAVNQCCWGLRGYCYSSNSNSPTGCSGQTGQIDPNSANYYCGQRGGSSCATSGNSIDPPGSYGPIRCIGSITTSTTSSTTTTTTTTTTPQPDIYNFSVLDTSSNKLYCSFNFLSNISYVECPPYATVQSDVGDHNYFVSVSNPSKNISETAGNFFFSVKNITSLNINCNECIVNSLCSCSIQADCTDGKWLISNSEGNPLTSSPIREFIPPLSINFTPNSTGKVNVTGKCYSPIPSENFFIVNITEKFFNCPSSCYKSNDCVCTVKGCNSGLFTASQGNATLASILITSNVASYKFTPTSIDVVNASAICIDPSKPLTSYIIPVYVNATTTTTTTSTTTTTTESTTTTTTEETTETTTTTEEATTETTSPSQEAPSIGYDIIAVIFSVVGLTIFLIAFIYPRLRSNEYDALKKKWGKRQYF